MSMVGVLTFSLHSVCSPNALMPTVDLEYQKVRGVGYCEDGNSRLLPSVGACLLGADYMALCRQACNDLGPGCIGFYVDSSDTGCFAVGEKLSEDDISTPAVTGAFDWQFGGGKGYGPIKGTSGDAGYTCYRKKLVTSATTTAAPTTAGKCCWPWCSLAQTRAHAACALPALIRSHTLGSRTHWQPVEALAAADEPGRLRQMKSESPDKTSELACQCRMHRQRSKDHCRTSNTSTDNRNC